MSTKHLKRIGRYEIAEIFPLIGAPGINGILGRHLLNSQIGLKSVKLNGSRIQLLKAQPECQCCGLKGSFFAMETDKTGSRHFNMYGFNEHGHEVLLTVDHITPRSLGGKNHKNTQVLCYHCNQAKANHIMSLQDLRNKIGKSRILPKVKVPRKAVLIERRSQLVCDATSGISLQILKMNINYQQFLLFHWGEKSVVIAKSIEDNSYNMAHIDGAAKSLYEFFWMISKERKKPRVKFSIPSLEAAVALIQA